MRLKVYSMKPHGLASIRKKAPMSEKSEKILPRDWRLMLESVHRINSKNTVWEVECEALRCLQQLIPCDQGMFFIYDGVDDSGIPLIMDSTAVVGQKAQFLDEFMNGGYNNDPYFRGMVFLRHNVVYRDSDILPEVDRINSRLFKSIYEKQGIYWGLRAYLSHNDVMLGNISIFNSKEAGDFSGFDINVLRLMEPHISLRLYQLRQEDDAPLPIQDDMAQLAAAQYGLTPREAEILSLLMSGMEDAAITDFLCISPSTLKKHVYNIYRKTNVSNRIQLYNLVK